jgi:adenylate cyclase
MNDFLSHQLTGQLQRVFWITVAWTMISIFMFLNVGTALQYIDCDLVKGQISLFFWGSLMSGLIAGIIGGSSIVFLWERWLRTKSYAQALIYIILSYTLIYVFVSLTGAVYFHSHSSTSGIMELSFWSKVLNSQMMEWQSYLFWLFVVMGTLFFLQVNDKYGPGTVWHFIRGKYFHPQREERIFMFLDLRGSTMIAEKLGEERYFRFLKDLYRHVTRPILNSRGQIYQYIGDEVVISWPIRAGKSHANCINCFFRIQWELDRHKEYYENTYDVLPEFKAGLHYGHVIAGEIGIVKRDITFSGDVLNTASRIQNKCNELGVNILLSQILVQKLNLHSIAFTPREMGEIILRGKKEKMLLYTV